MIVSWTSRARRAREGRDDAGTGLYPLLWGVTAFLAFLLLAVTVTLSLYTTSTVSAIGHDAARRAAAEGADAATLASAEAWMRSRLGAGITVDDLSVSVQGDHVVVRVVARPPTLLLLPAPGFGGPIERSFTVPIEDLVPVEPIRAAAGAP